MKTEKKRNGWYYIGDKCYPSITKIIGEVLAKPALLYWYAREATRIALANPELNEKEVMATLDLKVRNSQDRGKYVHSVAEEMPNIDTAKIKEEYKGYITALQGWWEAFKPVIINREVEAYSDKFGFACRVDFICELQKQIWLCDFKTSKTGEVYPESGLQLLAGKVALEEREIAKIDKMGTISLAETGEWVFKEMKDLEDDLKALLQLWKWKNRKGNN